jgi:hypothetical protein
LIRVKKGKDGAMACQDKNGEADLLTPSEGCEGIPALVSLVICFPKPKPRILYSHLHFVIAKPPHGRRSGG